MPLFTYTPRWDEAGAFLEKLRPFLPPDYSGLAGLRLHRTGYPLSLDLFGKTLPEKPLFPMIPLEFKGGKLVRSLADLEAKFETPWIRPEDFHAFRDDVMAFYIADDLLEARAEAVLTSAPLDEAVARKAIIDHEALPVGA